MINLWYDLWFVEGTIRYFDRLGIDIHNNPFIKEFGKKKRWLVSSIFHEPTRCDEMMMMVDGR